MIVEPTYIDQPAFTILGVVASAAPGSHDYERLWLAFDALAEHVRPLSADGCYYGAHVPGASPDVVDYVAGMAVADGVADAVGLVARVVPASRYAVFPCTVATIPRTYAHIQRAWRPPEGYAIDHTRADLEVYSPASAGPDAPVEIRVPLCRTGS